MGKLDELVTSYGDKHYTELALNKECKEMNNQIKDLLTADNLTEYTAGGYTVTKTITKSESLDEDKLLELLKSDWVSRNGSMQCPYIKTKYYVDMTELESALYKGDIPKDTIVSMDSCKVTKETVKLNLKRAKKED